MFTRKGYIKLLRDGQELTQHVDELEAVESGFAHGPGNYRITFPDREFIVPEGACPEVEDSPTPEPEPEPEPTPEPEPEPTGKVLFGPWDYDSETVGPAESTGPWNVNNNDPNEIRDGTGWWIADENPLVNGHAKYLKTSCNKNAGPEHYRCERSLSTNLRYPYTQEIVPVGDDQWVAPQKQWWGFLMRIDRADEGVDGPMGFYWQFHSPYTVGNTSSPMWGLRGRGSAGLAIYQKRRENSAPAREYTNHYESGIVLPWPEAQGKVHAHVIEYLPDSRVEGNEGLFRYYIDGELVFSFENQRNVTYGYAETGDRPYTPEFRHGLYVVGSHGGYFEQSYSHEVVMGPEATLEQMMDALQYKDIL